MQSTPYTDFVTEDSAVAPGHYFALLKPRVMVLVVFTAAMGMLAADADFHPILAVISVLAIALGAGAAGALNMWYEAILDGKMARTASRPLPSGVIARPDALGLAVFLAVASVTLLFLAANPQAALWLAVTICFYLFVYTIWLKPRTPQNIVIGGLAGALPPLIGWVAASGAASAYPWLMVAIIFLWTPPHSWALALFTASDYKNAGIPMLPIVAGAKRACRQILAYTAAMGAVGSAPYWLGFAGVGYLLTAVFGGGLMLLCSYGLWRAERRGGDLMAPARRLFKASLLYLPLVFLAIGAGL